MKKIWCGREDLKRLQAILKDLQDSGQQVAIIGHFTLQLGHIQDVTNVDNVREQSRIGLSETDAGKNPNRYITEHEQNGLDGNCPISSTALPSDLVEVIAAWSILPDSVKTGIMAMVRAILP